MILSVGWVAAQVESSPSPADVESALASVSRARNPTFVEFKDGDRGRTLVFGTVFSDQRLTDDLIDDFESAYVVLERRGWLSAFVAIELVVPQPLMRVTASLELIRSLKDKAITRTMFQERWRTDRLGPS